MSDLLSDFPRKILDRNDALSLDKKSFARQEFMLFVSIAHSFYTIIET